MFLQHLPNAGIPSPYSITIPLKLFQKAPSQAAHSAPFYSCSESASYLLLYVQWENTLLTLRKRKVMGCLLSQAWDPEALQFTYCTMALAFSPLRSVPAKTLTDIHHFQLLVILRQIIDSACSVVEMVTEGFQLLYIQSLLCSLVSCSIYIWDFNKSLKGFIEETWRWICFNQHSVIIIYIQMKCLQ